MKIPSLALVAALVSATAHWAAAQITTWPQQLASPAGEVTLYQPQIDTYSGNQFTAHAAVSVAQPKGKAPTFGAIFFTATLATDRDNGLATVQTLAVTNSRFPTAAQSTANAAVQAITQAGSQGSVTLSQTQLLAQLALTQTEQAAAANLNNTPPQIWFETEPSVLVTIDGEPKLAAAPNSSLLTVVNSPFFIALDPTTKTYYLHGGGQWLSTANVLQGPWTPVASVPAAVSTLAAAQPAEHDTAPTTGPAPQVLVATQPTELIQTAGPAEYGPIENTNLLYVTNTDSDVLMDIDTQSLYVLLSGRWFTSASPEGPWTFVPPAQLPADFSRIPSGLPISNVLASVPGTQTAQNAVLDAQVPQTAAIQRTAPGPKVTYDGAPKFEPVTGVPAASYAVNTEHSVVKVENTYYVCSDGAWFQAADPVGPWIVSITVPPVIYTIPPVCPIYPVTYCRIYSSTPDVVYCGYLPGYTGSYVYGGTVVYGTGWPYTPWFGTVFIPRPVTWGFAASFNPVWGGWGFAVGGGWGAAAFGCSWHSGWWGAANSHWNNWNQNVTINRNVTINNTTINRHVTNIYRNHPDRLTPQERARVENNDHPETAAMHHSATTVTHQPGQTEVTHRETTTARNDVYADRDGNIYRHNGSSWQQRDGEAWREPASRNFARTRTDLNRQFAARTHSEYHPVARGGGGGRRR